MGACQLGVLRVKERVTGSEDDETAVAPEGLSPWTSEEEDAAS